MNTTTGKRSEVERRPLGRQIADALRRDILFGQVQAGTRLSQQQLCDDFGTSRMPIRDALRQLVYEGLLVEDGSQHTIVAPLSHEDLHDTFLVEGILHGLAVRRATERATAADLTELDNLHDAMQIAEQENDPARMAGLNWEFHRRLNLMSGSRKLMAAIRAISIAMPRDYLVAFPQWMAISNKQHGQMIAAIRRGDADAAQSLAIEHMQDSGVDLVRYLESKSLNK